jgi:hypothetical protein
MAGWSSYALGDFLLFTRETYERLFALHNAAVWPAQLAALAVAAALVALVVRRPAWQGRAVAGLLVACWVFVGWTFLLERYAAINWVAPWLAGLFFLQATLLGALAVRPGELAFALHRDWRTRGAALLLLFGLLAQPLAAPLAGRPWEGVELFAVAPDPTITATLGILLLAERVRLALLAVPLLWCAISGATLWAMESDLALLMPTVGLAAAVLSAVRRRP